MSATQKKIRPISTKTVRVIVRKTVYRSITHSYGRKAADNNGAADENSVPKRERDRVWEDFEQPHSKENGTTR